MNAGGPIARPTTLSLAPRDAVSRMVARRRNRGSVHAGWSQLMLRWRRRSPRPTPAAARGTTIATHAYWFPQFHLHFTEHATQPQPQRSRRLPRAAHGLAAGQIRASRTQTSSTEEPPQVSRSLMWMATSLPHKRRSMRPSLERTPTLVHRRAAREQATLIDSIRPTRWRESKGSRLSTLRPADMPSPGAVARPSSRALHRPADLIWRTAPHTAAAVVDREAPFAAHVPPRPVPLAVRSTPDTSPVDAHKARPPVLSAASVDARLLDRLTDDVIRRIERRIRIERERRGL